MRRWSVVSPELQMLHFARMAVSRQKPTSGHHTSINRTQIRNWLTLQLTSLLQSIHQHPHTLV